MTEKEMNTLMKKISEERTKVSPEKREELNKKYLNYISQHPGMTPLENARHYFKIVKYGKI
jgi:hypothetical protein